MKAAYCFLRTVEHRLQMVADEQTHTLPAERAELERFARFSGFANRDAFANVLLGHLDKVQHHYARCSRRRPDADRPVAGVSSRMPTIARRSTGSAEMGFRPPLEASSIVRHWLSGNHRSLKSEAARSHLQALLPALLDHLARTDNPDATLVALRPLPRRSARRRRGCFRCCGRIPTSSR